MKTLNSLGKAVAINLVARRDERGVCNQVSHLCYMMRDDLDLENDNECSEVSRYAGPVKCVSSSRSLLSVWRISSHL